MEGKFLDDPSVRRIENLPSKKELMATIAYMIKKARGPARSRWTARTRSV